MHLKHLFHHYFLFISFLKFLGAWFEVKFHFKFTDIDTPLQSFTPVYERTDDPKEVRVVYGFLRQDIIIIVVVVVAKLIQGCHSSWFMWPKS